MDLTAELPDELILQIFLAATCTQLRPLFSVNKRWTALLTGDNSDEFFWQAYMKKHFGNNKQKKTWREACKTGTSFFKNIKSNSNGAFRAAVFGTMAVLADYILTNYQPFTYFAGTKTLQYIDFSTPKQAEQYGFPLHHAVREGDIDLVNLMIKYGAKPDIKDGKSKTAKEWAEEKGNVDVLLVLSPETILSKPEYLYQALKNKNLRAAKQMLELGIDVNYLHNNGNAAIHATIEFELYEITKYLLKEKNVSIDSPNKLQQSPLMIAVMHKNLVAVKFLVENGANVNYCREGKNALSMAIAQGEEQIYNYLFPLTSNPYDTTDKHGDTLFHVTAKRPLSDPHLSLLNSLIKNYFNNNNGNSNNDNNNNNSNDNSNNNSNDNNKMEELLKLLISKKNAAGNTPYSMCLYTLAKSDCKFSKTPFAMLKIFDEYTNDHDYPVNVVLEALISKNYHLIKMLINNNNNIYINSNNCNTTSKNNSKDNDNINIITLNSTVEFKFSSECLKHVYACENETYKLIMSQPSALAAITPEYINSHRDLIFNIVNKKVDEISMKFIDVTANLDYYSPVHTDTIISSAIKIKSFPLVNYLIQKKASVNHVQGDAMCPLFWAARTDYTTINKNNNNNSNNSNNSNNQNDNKNFIDILVEAGADVNYTRTDGSTALYEASNYGTEQNFYKIFKLMKDPFSTKCPSARNAPTLLHYFVNYLYNSEMIRMAEFLVKNGMPLEIRDDHGRTPLNILLQNNTHNTRTAPLVKAFIEHGAKDVDIKLVSQYIKTDTLELIQVLAEHKYYTVTQEDFFIACGSGALKILNYMFTLPHIDKAAKNQNGNGINHIVNAYCYSSRANEYIPYIEKLIAAGADVHNVASNSVLYRVCTTKNLTFADYFLSKGCVLASQTENDSLWKGISGATWLIEKKIVKPPTHHYFDVNTNFADLALLYYNGGDIKYVHPQHKCTWENYAPNNYNAIHRSMFLNFLKNPAPDYTTAVRNYYANDYRKS